jgi:hypothetical protein
MNWGVIALFAIAIAFFVVFFYGINKLSEG